MAENETQGEWTLPDGWVWTTLGEIGDYINGRAFKPSEWEERGKPIIRIQNLTRSSKTVNRCSKPVEEKYIVRDGDLLISWSATLGAYIYRGEEALLNQHIFRVQPHVDKMFLYYLTLAYLEELKRKVHGSGMQHITKSKFEESTVPLAPLPEQRRIVAEIETQFTRLDAGIAALERAQANLKRYRASVLKAACAGRLVPQDPADEPADQLLARILAERRARWETENPGKKYKEPASPDTGDLPELPEGWGWASLPQLGELNRGKSKHRPRNNERLFGGPYPFIQTGEVRKAEGVITTYSQTYSEFGLAQSRLWPKGTLCITIAANIAETAILGFDGCFPDSVVGFIPEDDTDVRFVEYFIRTAKEDLERYAPATAQKNINLQTLRGVAIPLPPLAEQRRIVAEVERRLSVVAALEREVEAALARAARLRQSILKRAFEGRLVAQDPDDEPAAALLARIRKKIT